MKTVEEKGHPDMRRMILLLILTLLLTSCGAAAAPMEPPEHQLPEETESADTADPGQMPELPVSDLDTPVAEEQPETDEGTALPEEGGEPAAEETGETQPARALDRTRPMVALTYDDGPHAVYTDQILDILEEHGAVATFFEVARNLPNAPDAVRRAAAMGCEVGSHSYRHADLGKMDKDSQLADQAAADALFQEVLGTTPTLLRPPYGSMNKTLKTTCGRSIVTWTIDPEDWLCKNAATVVSRVQGQSRLDGQVILLHSIYPSTVEATKTLVPWLQEQGYQLVTISELIEYRFNDQVEPNRSYNYDYFRFQVPELPTAAEPAAA